MGSWTTFPFPKPAAFHAGVGAATVTGLKVDVAVPVTCSGAGVRVWVEVGAPVTIWL